MHFSRTHFPLLLIIFVLIYSTSGYVQQAESPVYIMQRQISALMQAINANNEGGIRALQTQREARRVSISSLIAFYMRREFVMGRSEFVNRNKIRGVVHYLPKSDPRAHIWDKVVLLRDASSATGWKIDVVVRLPGQPNMSRRKSFQKKKNFGRRKFWKKHHQKKTDSYGFY